MSEVIEYPIRRRAGGESYAAGTPFEIPKLSTYDEALTAMGKIVRRCAKGELEIDAGQRLVQMIERMVNTMHKKRSHTLEERRLDLLGAAAEQGAAVFEGLMIIPPESRKTKDVTPRSQGNGMTIEQGPALNIKAPTKPGRQKRSKKG